MHTNKDEKRAELGGGGGKLPPLTLTVLMQGIGKPDRLAILADTGNAEATWWNWKRTPRIIPGGALLVILNHLSKAHGREISIQEAYKPVI
jgi:hypothetical protein